MFSNFIYFIIALLIYTTYQPAETPLFSYFERLFLFLFLSIIFVCFTWYEFGRLKKKSAIRFDDSDYKFNALMARYSVMAILLFAFEIYGLQLPAFFFDIQIFASLSTITALIFIMLFMLYLIIIWLASYEFYQKKYLAGITRRSYILSNISFAAPVILPWLLLSAILDIINLLPFDAPRQILSTVAGESVFFLMFLFIVAYTGPALIPKIWGCRPLDPGYFRSRIERLCKKADIEFTDILYWPIFGGRMITAGIMGITKRFRYILVTDALLRMLEPEELDMVISHEIGHVKKKHLLFYLLFFAGYMLIVYTVMDLIIMSALYSEFIFNLTGSYSSGQGAIPSIIFSFIMVFIFVIYFRYLFGYFMRNFERQADTYAYTLFNNAAPLISTFKKIALSSGQSPDKPCWHHFSITKRIKFLEKCEIDRSWIQRHERKIKKSVAVYVVAMLFIGGIGYQLNFGWAGRLLEKHFAEKIIEQEIRNNPDNPDLYKMMGDLFYEHMEYSKAVAFYEKSLSLDPDNPETLNNLAWVLVTCDDKMLFDPARSIRLAQRAAVLEKSSHILDTLAESYYAAGMYAEAVKTGREALKLVKTNKAYYKKQLEKFKQALLDTDLSDLQQITFAAKNLFDPVLFQSCHTVFYCLLTEYFHS
jgi:Zn-dependent protease with chaperone function